MNTTINHSDLHKFVIGDVRADGWKSQWRKDFEDYMEHQSRSQDFTAKKGAR